MLYTGSKKAKPILGKKEVYLCFNAICDYDFPVKFIRKVLTEIAFFFFLKYASLVCFEYF